MTYRYYTRFTGSFALSFYFYTYAFCFLFPSSICLNAAFIVKQIFTNKNK